MPYVPRGGKREGAGGKKPTRAEGRSALVQFRMRKDLHATLKAAAEEAGVSANQLARDVVERVLEAGRVGEFAEPEEYE